MASMHRQVLHAAAIVVLAAASVFGLSGQASAQEKVVTRFDWFPTKLHIPFHLAAAKGWLKDAGLDVRLDDGSGSGITVQLVAAGEVDVGYASLPVMTLARAKGVPVVAIGGIIRKNDIGLIIAEKYGVRSLKDIADRKLVVIYEQGGFMQPFIEPFFRNGGVAIGDVRLKGENPAIAISRYVEGQSGDAMITTVPSQIPLLKSKGQPSKFFMFYDHGLPLAGFGLVASEDTIKKRPEVLRKYLSVLDRAWAYTWASEKNAREAAQATINARPNAKLNVEFLVEGFEAYRPYISTDATKGKPLFWQAPEDWEATIKAMVGAGVIPASSNAKDFYTNAFVPGGSK